eukprot:TRINITY_DN203445_c0_g1_i1.p1 TRINITY_DN203445_c0_g1~~TRINITY_DN203445_c0_g1_i1.p1  ORF type:complete len:475 (-),score=109.48 TRINITY_DN203445_c0_g1_i1:266-1690(-)
MGKKNRKRRNKNKEKQAQTAKHEEKNNVVMAALEEQRRKAQQEMKVEVKPEIRKEPENPALSLESYGYIYDDVMGRYYHASRKTVRYTGKADTVTPLKHDFSAMEYIHNMASLFNQGKIKERFTKYFANKVRLQPSGMFENTVMCASCPDFSMVMAQARNRRFDDGVIFIHEASKLNTASIICDSAAGKSNIWTWAPEILGNKGIFASALGSKITLMDVMSEDPEDLWDLTLRKGAVTDMHFTVDGGHLAYLAEDPKAMLQILDLSRPNYIEGTRLKSDGLAMGFPQGYKDQSFSIEPLIAVGTRSGVMGLYDKRIGFMNYFMKKPSSIHYLKFGTDHSALHFIVADAKGGLCLHSLKSTAKPILTFEGHVGSFKKTAMGIEPSGQIFFAVGDDNYLRSWDLRTGAPMSMYKLPEGDVPTGMAFLSLPDSNTNNFLTTKTKIILSSKGSNTTILVYGFDGGISAEAVEKEVPLD